MLKKKNNSECEYGIKFAKIHLVLVQSELSKKRVSVSIPWKPAFFMAYKTKTSLF